MVKSLNLLLAPITEISEYLLEPVLIETLGSIFAISAIDRLTVGIPSIASRSKNVPVPILIEPSDAVAVTVISSISLETKVTVISVVLFKTRNTPPSDSVL